MFAIGVGMLALAFGGFAFGGFAAAGITPSPDNNGTVTPGQVLTFTASDTYTGDPRFVCNPSSLQQANGRMLEGETGAHIGYQAPLSVSCTVFQYGTWTFTGSISFTVPADASGTIEIGVTVEDTNPVNVTYSQIFTFTVAAPPTTNTDTTTTSTGGTTTTVTGGTTTATIPVAPSPPPTQPNPTTVTVTQTGTTTIETQTTAVVPSTTFVINVPSTITIRQAGGFIYITITTNQRSLQTLCWHGSATTKQTCSTSHGAWRIKLRKGAGKQVFLLKAHGKVVARKTVNIKLKP